LFKKSEGERREKMMNRDVSLRTVIVAAMIVFLAGSATVGNAQKFPNHPMTMIVAWGAGGGTDAVARTIAMLMEKDLGQPVNVVNRTGGSGAVGHTAAATAKPDGYTMALTTAEITMMHWMGLAQVNYKDMKGVSLVNFDPGSVTVRMDAPWRTLKELEDYIRANPGKLKASGTGKGGSWDLARAGWLKLTGIPQDAMPWVPSNGAAPALQELVAGGIDVVTCSLPEARAMIEAKKARPLVVMGDNRSDIFPDVPTLKEMGKNWVMGAWRGVTVPKGTPAEVVAVLEKSVEKAYNNPQYKEFMKKNGYGMVFKASGDFDKFMASEDESMGKLMKEMGIAK
jgi:tripartite-type tricarboxylate transporter receptor subunit TctC